MPPGSSEALHSVAACVHGPIWICQVALAPTAVCARGMRAHCRPPVCAQSRSLHTSSSLFKSGGCGALDAVKAFILSASFHPGHTCTCTSPETAKTRGAHGLRAPGVSCMPCRNDTCTTFWSAHTQHSRTSPATRLLLAVHYALEHGHLAVELRQRPAPLSTHRGPSTAALRL